MRGVHHHEDTVVSLKKPGEHSATLTALLRDGARALLAEAVQAALRDRDTGPAQQLATFEIDTEKTEAGGFEPLWAADRVAGYTTSGGYGHTTGKSLAMGYLNAEYTEQKELEVSILGERKRAVTSARA